MKQVDLISGLIVFLCSVMVLSESRKLEISSSSGIGPGFLPFWLSLATAALGITLIFGALRRRASLQDKAEWPRGRSLVWIGATIAALVAYPFVVSIAGYILSTFVFMWALIWLLGSYRWYWSGAVSLAFAAGLYIVFRVLLSIQLPTGVLIIP